MYEEIPVSVLSVFSVAIPILVIPDSPQARSGIQENESYHGMDWRGFWIPARAPRQQPGRLAGMTEEKIVRL